MKVQCVSTDNEDWKYNVDLPEVPFPGDEVVCGSWGPMRVIRRSYVCLDSPSDDRQHGGFRGVIIWVREEQAS
jgi:hypothetical protein